jgi:sulfoxide reductase heme-binding subunit YedZ
MIERLNGLAKRLPAWPLYPLGLIPAAWLWYLGLTGGLGPDPVKTLERELGEIGLQILIGVLCIAPLRRFLGLNLLKFRRAVGLLAFYYVLQHFGVWLLLDVGRLDQIAEEIVKRPYVTAGFAGFLLLLPLALTSTDRAVRRLGPQRWRQVHRLVYWASVAGIVHYIWLTKGFPLEPMIYAALLAAILAARLLPRRRIAAAAV